MGKGITMKGDSAASMREEPSKKELAIQKRLDYLEEKIKGFKGWSHWSEADKQASREYRRAVLEAEYDRLGSLSDDEEVEEDEEEELAKYLKNWIWGRLYRLDETILLAAVDRSRAGERKTAQPMQSAPSQISSFPVSFSRFTSKAAAAAASSANTIYLLAARPRLPSEFLPGKDARLRPVSVTDEYSVQLAAPAAVDATCVPWPSPSLGDWGLASFSLRVSVLSRKDLAPTSLLLHMLALNRSPSSHLPFQLGRTEPSPVSLKLALSGHIPVSTKPMMTPSPKSVSGHTPNSVSRPRKPGDLVVCSGTTLSALYTPATPGVLARRRAWSSVSSAAKPCITVSYT
ncbi:hypothetical protein EJB05_11589 [Eragrostis curvula]|uniref:Uncharacterized protein n=1 Tax=Eragrostis curvula TaxID=38414 RepID=A0A5J9VPE2_9POAL|nr:hypothetical protein EJB05_11589 [Eragrostis curvula]